MKNNLIAVMCFFVFLFLNSCINHSKKEGSETANITGVKYFDSIQVQPGLTMLDRVSKDGWCCTLIDMNGNVIKEYNYSLVMPNADGSYLAIDDTCIVKLNSALNVIWRTPVPIEPHHELTTDEQGNIYVLSSDVHEFMGLKVKFDGVKIFSPQGKLLSSWCVYDHLDEFVSIISKSAWTEHMLKPNDKNIDVRKYILQDPVNFIFPTNVNCAAKFEFTHFNALQVLPDNSVSKKIPAFRKGNLMLSFHPYSCYGILNIKTGKIEWVGYLPERTKLHSTKLSKEGTILVFQNATDSVNWIEKGGYDSLHTVFKNTFPKVMASKKPSPRLWTSITEYNPLTNEKVWEYTATPKESLQATSRGSVEREPNGNILICATTKENGGHVFELNSRNEIVWDYAYPKLDIETNKPWSFYRARRVPSSISNLILQQTQSKR